MTHVHTALLLLDQAATAQTSKVVVSASHIPIKYYFRPWSLVLMAGIPKPTKLGVGEGQKLLHVINEALTLKSQNGFGGFLLNGTRPSNNFPVCC